MVNADARADNAFTHIATWLTSLANKLAKWPMSIKNGAPGGWPTSNFQAELMNSPQSQKLAVGSIVIRYVTAAMANTTQPQIAFHNLNFFIINCLFYFFTQFISPLNQGRTPQAGGIHPPPRTIAGAKLQLFFDMTKSFARKM